MAQPLSEGDTALWDKAGSLDQGWGGIERHSTPRESGLSCSRRLGALVVALLYRSVFSWEIMTFPG